MCTGAAALERARRVFADREGRASGAARCCGVGWGRHHLSGAREFSDRVTQRGSGALLAAATRIAKARERGAKLIVVDPRHVGFAVKADCWLQVRPGTDAAVALAIAGIMIDEAWFDAEFVRQWTNGPFLVRESDGMLLSTDALADGDGNGNGFAVWDEGRGMVLRGLAIATPRGRVRAQARLNATLANGVVAARHGWWQACPGLGLPGYDALGADGANINLTIGVDTADRVSGAAAHRRYPCRIDKLD